jgi:hypothetical protein
MGHGGNDRMASEGLLLKSDVPGLVNATRPGVVVALTCSLGRFEQPGYDSLGEDLVRKTTGGSVAVWSPTGLSVNHRAELLGQAFLSARFLNGAATLGDAILAAHQAYGAQGADSFRLAWIYNLLGDPALRTAGQPIPAAPSSGEVGVAQRPAAAKGSRPVLPGAGTFESAASSAGQNPAADGSVGEEGSTLLVDAVLPGGLFRVAVGPGTLVRVVLAGEALPVLTIAGGSVVWYQPVAGQVTVTTGEASPDMAEREAVPALDGESMVIPAVDTPATVRLEEPVRRALAVGRGEAPIVLDVTDPHAPVALKGIPVQPDGLPPAVYFGSGPAELLIAVPESIPLVK